MEQKHKKILQIRDFFCDGNNRKFAEKIGFAEQYVSNIANGKKPVTTNFLRKIYEAFPEINKSWLFLGDGEMLGNSTGNISNNHAGGDIPGNGAVQATPENAGNIAELLSIVKQLTETNLRQTEQISALIELLKKQQ